MFDVWIKSRDTLIITVPEIKEPVNEWSNGICVGMNRVAAYIEVQGYTIKQVNI